MVLVCAPEELDSKMNKLCFIVPYFGKWPFWFDFYLRSCAENPCIDWVFYTDCGVPENVPVNVRFVEISFNEYCFFVSGRLGVSFFPISAYKLCDIKPALGFIHEEDLRGYENWGFGDIDVVYGDLGGYLTDSMLSTYGLISTHARRVSGHLCVMQNTQRWREAFMSVSSWREQFESIEHLAFDERAFTKLFVKHKNWPVWASNIATGLNPWRRRTDFTEQFSSPGGAVDWRGGGRKFPERWIWSDGELTCDIDDFKYPYFHFIHWKGAQWAQRSVEELVRVSAGASVWEITEKGFGEGFE